MKFVFHAARFDSPFGPLCSALTSGPWSHGSFITDDGKHLDTTMSRGYLGLREPEPERWVVVYDLPSVKLWFSDVVPMLDTPYDSLGLFFYPLAVQDDTKLFCFESQVVAAKLAGLDLDTGSRPSPKKMIEVLKTFTNGIYIQEKYLI